VPYFYHAAQIDINGSPIDVSLTTQAGMVTVIVAANKFSDPESQSAANLAAQAAAQSLGVTYLASFCHPPMA